MFRIIWLWVWLTSTSLSFANPPESALEVADTSSPRTTLLGFIEIMNQRFETFYGNQGNLQRYLRSGLLFPSKDMVQDTLISIQRERAIAAKYLDLRGVPSAMLDQSAWRLCAQLKEILDRVPLPSELDIPDSLAAMKLPHGQWTLPGSEIRIALIDSGPKTGQYLFTQETVAQIPDFYKRIQAEPYLSKGSEGLYELIFGKPFGVALVFRDFIPPRWVLSLPEWTQSILFGEPIWRWLGLIVLAALVTAALRLSHRLSVFAQRGHPVWDDVFRLLPTGVILFLVPLSLFLIGEALRLPPQIFAVLNVVLWTLFDLTLTYAVWRCSAVLAKAIIRYERIPTDHTDSQLILIASRLVGVVAAIGILIEGSSRLGLPSYSILAGLGVGGLAFALAGQQALGNLIGSLILMLEKPFRIGDCIKAGGFEGDVEGIGFRTTRIRTLEGTLVAIPSSELTRLPIENLSLRPNCRVRKTLHLDSATSPQALDAFMRRITDLLNTQPDVPNSSVHVDLIDLSPTGPELLVDFQVDTKITAIKIERTSEILKAIHTEASQIGMTWFTETRPD